jgi:hypothetical protein
VRIAITGNRVIGGNNGIRMQAQSTATGNVITGAAFNGIVLTGTNNVVCGNHVIGGSTGILNTGLANTISGNVGTGIPLELYHSATPEGAIPAPVGSRCVDTATGAIYRKTSGVGNTGWVTP